MNLVRLFEFMRLLRELQVNEGSKSRREVASPSVDQCTHTPFSAAAWSSKGKGLKTKEAEAEAEVVIEFVRLFLKFRVN